MRPVVATVVVTLALLLGIEGEDARDKELQADSIRVGRRVLEAESEADEAEKRNETERDPFTYLIKFGDMQPIYLLPVTNGIKQLAMFVIFGFDFKTKIKEDHTIKKRAVFALSSLVKLIVLVMVLNGYHSDFNKFRKHAETSKTWWGMGVMMLAIWITSSNYSPALGLWGSFKIQAPAVIFEEDVDRILYKNTCSPPCYPRIAFPFRIGGAHWLGPVKQIYALVLLPYALPALFMDWGGSILAICYWNVCRTKCICCLGSMKQIYFFLLALPVLIFTTGKQNDVGETFAKVWPFIYLACVQFYAYELLPVFFAVLYGLAIGASRDNIVKGLGLCQHEPHDEEQKLEVPYSESTSDSESDSSDTSSLTDCCCSPVLACVQIVVACMMCLCKMVKSYRWLTASIHLNMPFEDRKLLIRLDWSRLGKDFWFSEQTMQALSPYQHVFNKIDDKFLHPAERVAKLVGEKMQEKEKKRDEQSQEQNEKAEDADEEQPDEVKDIEFDTRQGRSCLDIWVGRDILESGDINVLFDDALRTDLYPDGEFFLNDSLTRVVLLTMREIAKVAVQQALVIFVVRVLYDRSFENFEKAMAVTIQERTISAYLHHVVTIGEEKIGRILDTIWGL